MNHSIQQNEMTRKHLVEHYKSYPNLQAEDVFKYIFQSALGCEHLVSSYDVALAYIKREYEMVSQTEEPHIDPLDGEYSRVYLSHLNNGLAPETFAKLFCLSAKVEVDGKNVLIQKVQVANELVKTGVLPIDRDEFEQKLATWQALEYPAVHHSNIFREKYHPAYRVLANRYVRLLPTFIRIDQQLAQGSDNIIIKTQSADEGVMLENALQEVYGSRASHVLICNCSA